MESLPQSSSHRNSQSKSNETADLQTLTGWLKGLMATVKVTNVIARKDPDTAIKAMAEVCLKFPPDLIKATVDGLKIDPDAVWPTAGEMVDMLKRKVRVRDGVRTQHRMLENIDGLNYQQLLRGTTQGRKALADGKPHSFLQDVIDGKIPTASLNFDRSISKNQQPTTAQVAKSPAGQKALENGYFPSLMIDIEEGNVTLEGALDRRYIERRANAALERMTITEQLKANHADCQKLGETERNMLIKLGETMGENNRIMAEKYLNPTVDMF